MSRIIFVLGGDMRIVMLANGFNRDGYEVMTYGFSDDVEFEAGIERCESMSCGLDKSDVVIVGLPASEDDINVSTPLWNGEISFDSLLKGMRFNQRLIGGKISGKIRDKCRIYNVEFIDYLDREELAVLNAVPTAEGAIEIAMKLMPTTICKSNSLVLGFGRIGKVLAKDLKGLGANTYVEARKYEDLAWISAYGHNGIYLPDLKESLPVMDVIYNTIPHQIITSKLMKYIRKDCPFIDLASMPGGIDDVKASEHGIKVVHALSLPGKTSPKTAGDIIKQTVLNIFSDMGV